MYLHYIWGNGTVPTQARFFIFILFIPVVPSGNNPLTIGLCDFLGQPL